MRRKRKTRTMDTGRNREWEKKNKPNEKGEKMS